MTYREESRKHEERLAERVGGSVTPMSGGGWMRKGDIHRDEFIFEHKFAPSKRGHSITFATVVFAKTIHEALTHRKRPGWMFTLGPRDYVILRLEDFEDLLGER